MTYFTDNLRACVFHGATVLGTGQLSGGSASFTISTLPTGSNAITASYSGDSEFFTSTSNAVKQVVNAAYPTTTVLSSSLNSTIYGQAVTLTATVTSAGPAPTGRVSFRSGSSTLGDRSLSLSGVATLTTEKIPVGTDTLTAIYLGRTPNGESVSSGITQTVSQASVSMTLTSVPNPSTFGKLVKLTATLTSNGSMPSGQPVTFSVNGTTLGTAKIHANGVATLMTITLPQGADTVTAEYAGSADYSSASASVTQVVN